MSATSGWEKLLQAKYHFYDVEKAIYVENRNKANSVDMFAKSICDKLRPGDVPDNLQKLYNEAVYRTDPKVKSRIHKRVYGIGTRVR